MKRRLKLATADFRAYGLNTYAAYHVMHGALDPTGLQLQSKYQCCDVWERGYMLLGYPDEYSCAAHIYTGNNPLPNMAANGLIGTLLLIMKAGTTSNAYTIIATAGINFIAYTNAMATCREWYCQTKSEPVCKCVSKKGGYLWNKYDCKCPKGARIERKGGVVTKYGGEWGIKEPNPITTGVKQWYEKW